VGWWRCQIIVVVVRKNSDLKNKIVVCAGVNGHLMKILFVVAASGEASRKRIYLAETVLVFRSKHPKVERKEGPLLTDETVHFTGIQTRP
jgi:hypothetical protein